jgi:predicted nucleic acid-binding Zn ribbon protein
VGAADGGRSRLATRRTMMTWLLAGTIVALVLVLCALAFEAGRQSR